MTKFCLIFLDNPYLSSSKLCLNYVKKLSHQPADHPQPVQMAVTHAHTLADFLVQLTMNKSQKTHSCQLAKGNQAGQDTSAKLTQLRNLSTNLSRDTSAETPSSCQDTSAEFAAETPQLRTLIQNSSAKKHNPAEKPHG